MIYLPTLHAFAMNNVFTGSWKSLRFKLTPQVVKMENSREVDMEASRIFAELWHGIFCYEKSQIEKTETFPMSEEGREALRAWLEANIESD
ncbi:MAG: hypothetical protein E7464_04935 [Ruminococcaceae bacterium]|nr:hypothetical protein [Oscillospiraceae bacterium]